MVRKRNSSLTRDTQGKEASKKTGRKTGVNAAPYVAGGAMGAVIGAGVGVAAAAVIQNQGARQRVTEVFDRMREIPQTRQILGGGQQKAGMKLGRVAKRGKKKSGRTKEGIEA